jgi:hypothetical protein
MQTDEWGPAAWKMLHMISFNYPLEPDEITKKNYKIFFEILQYILPCSYCRTSYANFLKFIFIDDYLDSRDGLIFWLFILHNLVNRKLKKKLETFDTMYVRYENLRARCGKIDDIDLYNKCKSELKPITIEDVKDKILKIYSKYNQISKIQIYNYYNSDVINDPKLIKNDI